MNIHIKDSSLFQNLINATIATSNIGSTLYGTSDSKSDKDLMYIYADSLTEEYSHLFSHHQLQYKSENTDYIFTSVKNFLRNCLNGDSTINFEVIYSDQLVNTPLEFLHDLRFSFYNYKVMRSYLGFAKRDILQSEKNQLNEIKIKKICHAMRSFDIVKKIYSGSDIFPFSESDIYKYKNIINNFIKSDRLHYEKNLLIYIDELRNKINRECDSGKITKHMKVEDQLILDDNLYFLFSSKFYLDKRLTNIDMKIFYDAEENQIKY